MFGSRNNVPYAIHAVARGVGNCSSFFWAEEDMTLPSSSFDIYKHRRHGAVKVSFLGGLNFDSVPKTQEVHCLSQL